MSVLNDGAPVTCLWAGLLGFVGVALSLRAVTRRRSARIMYGDGGDAIMQALSRSHGNFSEYAPFGVILCGLAELSGRGGPVLLHTLGVLMLAGRTMYAYASGVPAEQMLKSMARVYCRIWGMVLTYASLAGASALCIGLPSVGGWAAVVLFLAMGSTKSPSSRARAAIRKNSEASGGGDKQ